MEELLDNNNNNNFFIGNTFSAVDGYFLYVMQFITSIYPEALSGRASLVDHMRVVAANETIKNYYEKNQ